MDAIRSGRRRTAGRPRRGRRRGLVLVASVGMLGVISVMGLAFATVMRLEARAARNYTQSVRAEFVARAGIEDAIGRLRVMAREGAETSFLTKHPLSGAPLAVGQPADWYTWRGTAGGDYKKSFGALKESNWLDDDEDGKVDGEDTNGDGTGPCGFTEGVGDGCFYTLKIEDAASKINVNVGDNLGTILDNLCRVIGPPLVAADQRALVPKWFSSLLTYRSYGRDRKNVDDRLGVYDLFYRLGDDGRPRCESTAAGGVGQGSAVYGDGYAIAGYRARHGEFLALEDVRHALTWIERGDGDGDGDAVEPEADTPDEIMEVESKFAALRPYITIDSYHDTDQIGYGKFEQVRIVGGHATELTDRNACWNVRRNPDTGGPNDLPGGKYAGELKDCYVAIVNGVGQNQIKTIAGNTIDTIFLRNTSMYPGREMRVPPNQHSSYIIIGKDAGAAGDPDWQKHLKLYARQPLSFHRAPVNINTASDKVLVAVLMGLQTTWGRAGYATQGKNIDDMGGWAGTSTDWADAMWQCPSVISVGRDDCNAYLSFGAPCPNDRAFPLVDASQQQFGHVNDGQSSCFFCSFGHLCPEGNRLSSRSREMRTNEAHYLAWQILKEREQTAAQDLDARRFDKEGKCWANGYGPFRGWDDVFYRVFYPHENALMLELHSNPQQWVVSSKTGVAASSASSGSTSRARHPGIARLCMANFNSNTGLLKFQPNLEYIDRWGPNFTDLFLPRPELLESATKDEVDIKLRVRPGELLDKTDLNIGTTEFCFDSGGVYDVESVGRVYDTTKTVTAERKFRALVKIYDVWRESTQREFVKGIISVARHTAGTVQAGQFCLDGSGGIDRRDFRKALCTYPEPIVPIGHAVGKVIGAAPTAELPKGATLVWDPANPDPEKRGFPPAGYDGQILLATNVLYQTVMVGTAFVPLSGDEGNVDSELGFYHSFTGDIIADTCRGIPFPGDGSDGSFSPDPQVNPLKKNCPLDKVSLLGALDAKDCDLAPVTVSGTVIEGEGKGGDFRNDGVHLGVVGFARMDGAFEFEMKDNLNRNDGAITMWLKPMWHHGTVARASLPVEYKPRGSDQRGSTVCIPRVSDYGPKDAPGTLAAMWKDYWRVSPLHRYDSGISIGAGAAGFVRDRFEYELFNGVKEGGGAAACNFRFAKTGDINSSIDDMDWWGNIEQSRPPTSALNWGIDDCGCDSGAWIPGHLAAGGRPFYQMAPFRWSFIGFTWDLGGLGTAQWPMVLDWSADPMSGRGENGPGWGNLPDGSPMYDHRQYGQPLDMGTLVGDLIPGGTGHGKQSGLVRDWGNELAGDQNGDVTAAVAVPYGHKKDRTAREHFNLLRLGRPFVDGQCTWNKIPFANIRDDGKVYDSRHPFTEGYDLEDWAFEQYGVFFNNCTTPDDPLAKLNAPGWYSFGINKATSADNYQAFFSGTYATMDEYRISIVGTNKHAMDNLPWARNEWRKTGRYYFPVYPKEPIDNQINSGQEPSFESQTMYDSERSQAFTFELGEEDDEFEVCTVRWTVFTPYFCVEEGPSFSGGGGEWRFPYDGYFDSDDGASRFEWTFRKYASPAQIRLFKATGLGRFNDLGKFSETFQTEIKQEGVASRISSQRGCKVQVKAGADWFPGSNVFYEHPEGGYTDPNDAGCTEDGWQQVLLERDPATTTKQHPKCGPKDLKYRVFFRLSDKEYDKMKNQTSVLVDSPVFDDITITCMRRPKVLEWQDVSE